VSNPDEGWNVEFVEVDVEREPDLGEGWGVELVDIDREHEFIDSVLPGQPGPPGLPGLTGEAGLELVSRMADSTISGHRAVRATGMYTVDTVNLVVSQLEAVFGITTQAVVAGAQVQCRVHGAMQESSWAWTPGLPIFCGAGGLLVQVPPLAPALRQVAVALSATVIMVDLRPVIVLN